MPKVALFGRPLVALALAMAIGGCGADPALDRIDDGEEAPGDDTSTPTGSVDGDLPEGDGSVGTVTTKTDGEPTITKFVTYTLKDGSFPTYLAHTVGGSSPNSVFQNVTIKNPSGSPKTVVLRGSLEGYTKEEALTTVNLGPNEEKSGRFNVTLDFGALAKVSTPVSASFKISLGTPEGKVLFASSKPTTVHSKNTVFWTDVFKADKPGVAEKLVASATFTTPRDGWGEVDKLLKEAAPYSKTKSMWGYNGYHKASNTVQQDGDGANDMLGAIWSALKARGFNYTSVSGSFFEGAQTVRYPAESLRAGTGNCIDGTLVFASALEAIGMAPIFVYVPGHVFIAVHASPKGTANYSQMAMVETTMLGSGKDYAAARDYAITQYKKHGAAGSLLKIELADGRAKNWLPAPYPM